MKGKPSLALYSGEKHTIKHLLLLLIKQSFSCTLTFFHYYYFCFSLRTICIDDRFLRKQRHHLDLLVLLFFSSFYPFNSDFCLINYNNKNMNECVLKYILFKRSSL